MTEAVNLALANELDRFDVPPLSIGLADRIVAATAKPTSRPLVARRRDRRGIWRRGRQVLLGTLAVGLLSAGAIASGLLGRVGIEVPILTAMLAPKTKPVVKHAHLAPRRSERHTAIEASPETSAQPVQLSAARPLLSVERRAIRQERRERREEFAAEHPVAAAVIGERVHEQLRRRAMARRQALMTPGIDPALPGVGALNFADRAALARAARHDRIVAEKMIDRRILARESRISEKQRAEGGVAPELSVASVAAPEIPLPVAVDPSPQPNPISQRMTQAITEQRAARRARVRQMSLEQRIQFRERMQHRRALRLGRNRQDWPRK